MKKQLLFIGLCFYLLNAGAQQNPLYGWHLKDSAVDGYYGISLDQAYHFLVSKKIKSTPVVVAVLDSGIDTTHEDLKQVLWTNSKEIPGNKKDDDGNGYKDDVHGWNFLGNPDGRNVSEASSEWIRVYWRYKDKYEGKTIDAVNLSPEQRYEYAMWQKARGGVVGQGLPEDKMNNLLQFQANILFSDSIMKKILVTEEYMHKDFASYKPKNEQEKNIKSFLTEVFKQAGSEETKNTMLLDDVKNYVAGEQNKAKADKIPVIDYHLEITGDDEKNLQTTHYGSGDIEAVNAEHGTHVSGIIAAVRNNGIGIDGIADNVKIMMVRCVPVSDEYDKDIALGIRYAVDNGAKIISMSFGKSLSPDKKFIDDAVKYAASKDVLLVQGAGNSKRDIDAYDNFPNPKYFLTDSIAPNWITVGASDANGMAASFSNYGVKAVDVFAPGMVIYSTIPGSKYIAYDGTSMATPVVSGIAALLRSYFPQLTAEDIKKIIEQTVVKPSPKTLKPGSQDMVLMDQLCKAGGIVNAFNAVKLASAYKK